MSLGFDKNKGIEYPCDKCDLINVTFVNILSQINFTLEDVFRQNIVGSFHDLYVCAHDFVFLPCTEILKQIRTKFFEIKHRV